MTTWVMWLGVIDVDDLCEMAVVVVVGDVGWCHRPHVVQCVCVGLIMPVLFDTAAFGLPCVISTHPCLARCASFNTSVVGSDFGHQAPMHCRGFPAMVLAYSRHFGGG